MDRQKFLCKLGYHNWSPNCGGMRVCLAKGCTTIDLYYGITGMLRYIRERYTVKELMKIAGVKD